MKYYYCDHAATTPCRAGIWARMGVYATQEYGNSNSFHRLGRNARAAVEKARADIAQLLGAEPDQFIFTSGGTESIQLALRGAALSSRHLGSEIVTTAIEHEAALRACESLRSSGMRVKYLQPDGEGRVWPDQVAEAVGPDTAIISVMHANNEVGTIQDVAAIVAAARKKKASVMIHSDAVQSVGHIPVDLQELDVDLLSFAAHKFYGPKGIGGLYVRRGVKLHPDVSGGVQECGMRGGTLSVPLIVGMAEALRSAVAEMEGERSYWRAFRDRTEQVLLNEVPGLRINARTANRLDHFLHLSVRGVQGEDLVLLLDQNGICASGGAACNLSRGGGSHVLDALRLPRAWNLGSLRLSFGQGCRGLDSDWLAQRIAGAVAELRGTFAMPVFSPRTANLSVL